MPEASAHVTVTGQVADSLWSELQKLSDQLANLSRLASSINVGGTVPGQPTPPKAVGGLAFIPNPASNVGRAGGPPPPFPPVATSPGSASATQGAPSRPGVQSTSQQAPPLGTGAPHQSERQSLLDFALTWQSMRGMLRDVLAPMRASAVSAQTTPPPPRQGAPAGAAVTAGGKPTPEARRNFAQRMLEAGATPVQAFGYAGLPVPSQPPMQPGAVAAHLATRVAGPAGVLMPLSEIAMGSSAARGLGLGAAATAGLGAAFGGAALAGAAFASGLPFSQQSTALAMNVRTPPNALYSLLNYSASGYATPSELMGAMGEVAGAGIRPTRGTSSAGGMRNSVAMVFLRDAQSAAQYSHLMGIGVQQGGAVLSTALQAGVALQGAPGYLRNIVNESLRSGMTGGAYSQGVQALTQAFMQQGLGNAPGLLAGTTAFGNLTGLAPFEGIRAVQTLQGLNSAVTSSAFMQGLPGPLQLQEMSGLLGHTPQNLLQVFQSYQRGINTPKRLSGLLGSVYQAYQGNQNIGILELNNLLQGVGGVGGQLGTGLLNLFNEWEKTPGMQQKDMTALLHGKAITVNGKPMTFSQLQNTYLSSYGESSTQLLGDIKSVLQSIFEILQPFVTIMDVALKPIAELLMPLAKLENIPTTGLQATVRNLTTPNPLGNLPTQHTGGTQGTSPLGGLLNWAKGQAQDFSRWYSGTPTTTSVPSTPTAKSFVNSMLPYAQEAAKATGLPVDFILGQWGNESAWGTSAAAQQNANFAGIKPSGQYGPGEDTKYAGFSSIAQFVKAYEATINKPRYAVARTAAARGASAKRIGELLAQGHYATVNGQPNPNYGPDMAAAESVVKAALAGQDATLQTDAGKLTIHFEPNPRLGEILRSGQYRARFVPQS